MKPKSFFDLPRSVQERLLRDMELDYCPYESSKAECIDQISNGNVYSPNDLIIANYYKALSLEDLLVIASQELETAERRVVNLIQLQAVLRGEVRA